MQLQVCEESFTPTKLLQSKWKITLSLITLHFQTAINNAFFITKLKGGLVALQVLSAQKYQIPQLLTQDKASWLQFGIITFQKHKECQEMLRFLFPAWLLNSQLFCVLYLVCGFLLVGCGGFRGSVCVCVCICVCGFYLCLFLCFLPG